jgi:hypothetical protein
MTIGPMGAGMMQAEDQRDGQTDMTKIIVAFRNSAHAKQHRDIKKV